LVFAIAFVTTGVKRIDLQAIGSGVAFRVLIFPASGFWNWGAPGREESAAMIQPHRTIHRRIFFVLALLLPVLFLGGISFRYSWPTANMSRSPTTHPLPLGATP
jgi:hypothetical protein